jgi:glycogen operon protein
VTAHDGFTLEDLVSYNEKHNEANGEDGADGESHNLSWNCGVEGPTDDPQIVGLRERQKRNFIATLFLSQGVPMLCGGDELGRTQGGNNNAYCQDNEISWHDWKLDDLKRDFREFVRYMIHLRSSEPVLQRRRFFQGRLIRGAGIKDATWFRPNGNEMDDRAWSTYFARCLGFRLLGSGLDEVDAYGDPVVGNTLFVVLNAHHERVRFVLPDHPEGRRWERILDTAEPEWRKPHRLADRTYLPKGRSVVVLRDVPALRKGDSQ